MASAKVVVNLADGAAYDVLIGPGKISSAGMWLAEMFPGLSKAVIITDSNVGPLYSRRLRASFAESGISSIVMSIPAGEASKNIDCAVELWRALVSRGIDRDAVVVALGGGVVGDIAGFVAATYLRGVSYVQVPTTLLAMVDSSVGGKCAIDLPEGKNLIGAFKQPAGVCADMATLVTLDDAQWACGCAEIVKSAILCGDEFYFWLISYLDDLFNHEETIVQEAITRSVVFKSDVVAHDEYETEGVRECLNFGHTLAHAIEKLAGYGTYTHGQAVAEGMRFAMRLGAALEGVPLDLVSSVDDTLDQLGLHPIDFSADVDEVIGAMKTDKKARAGRIRFAIVQDIGKWTVREVDETTLREHLRAWSASKKGQVS